MIIMVPPQDMWRYAERNDIEVVVNPCNCVGASGKGISEQVMSRWPSLERRYKRACRDGLRPGMLALHRQDDGPDILHFPTKDHWRGPSKLADVVSGLEKLRDSWDRLNIDSILIPPLGCGYGRLKWVTVRKLILLHLKDLDGHIYVLEQKKG